MQERVRSWLQAIRDRWNGLERRQKFQIAGAAAAVVLALIVTLIFVFRPNMTVVYPRVDFNFATSAQNALDEAGIRNEYRNGDLYVTKADQYKAIAVVESQPIVGLEKYTFSDVVANSGMGTTQTMQKESLKRAQESTLGTILEQFDGVKSAHVQLNLVDDSNFFLTPTQVATAAVTLETTRQLSETDGLHMAQMISKAVAKLEMENITIIDQNFNIIYSADTQGQGGFAAQSDFELQYQSIKESKVRAILNPIYPDVRVMSNFVFDWDQIVQRSTTYSSSTGADDGTGVIGHEETDKQSGTNTDTAQAPGTDTNNATTPQYPTENGTSSTVSINNRLTDYLQNVVEQEKVSGNTGSLVTGNSSMAVVCQNFRDYYEDRITPTQLNGQTWEDFKATTLQAQLPVSEDLLNLLRTGTGVANISVMALETPVFHDAVVKPLNIWLIVMMALLFVFIVLLAYGLIRRTQVEEVVEVEPELSVEELLVSTQIEEEKQKEIDKLREIEFGEDSEVKKQIQKFISEKPEAVAVLLRNWLNDGWD